MLSFCFFFKQKSAYELRISDWSSDVCSSDLVTRMTFFWSTPSSELLVHGLTPGGSFDPLLVSWVRSAPLPHPAPAATAIAADQIRSGHSPAACAGTTDRTPCCARTRASAPVDRKSVV